MADLIRGDDGVTRCGWCGTDPLYVSYHDTEWGRPVRGDVALFERICLEGFQSGLSWLTILRKREAFRRAFAGFEPDLVAGFGVRDVDRLLADAGIVRNRRKIEATIANARAVAALRQRGGPGALDLLVWSHRPPVRPRPGASAELVATTPASAALAASLKGVGMVFVGPTTMHALMQACGLVDDHLAGCGVR